MTKPLTYLILGALAVAVSIGEIATSLAADERINWLLLISMGLLLVSMTLGYRTARKQRRDG